MQARLRIAMARKSRMKFNNIHAQRAGIISVPLGALSHIIVIV